MAIDFSAIERAALRAWPAADDRWLGDWVVRRDRGYTKRANCIYAWGPADSDLTTQIETCADLLHEFNLPVIIREATWNPIPGFADFAAGQGLAPFDETIVMTRPLVQPSGWSPAPAPAIELDQWLDCYVRFEGGTKGNQDIHRDILERIGQPKVLAVQSDEEIPVSIGLAVADGSLVGLFDIATDPNQRGRGHGRVLIEGMLAWAQVAGCNTAYLQVMSGNASAIRLYQRLGFVETFRYHYFALENVPR